MDPEYEDAKKRVKELKGFYTHLFIYIMVNVTLFIINLVSTPGAWWFYWVTVFWGIGLMWHGVGVLSGRRFLGKDWEEKKIQEYMKKEKK